MLTLPINQVQFLWHQFCIVIIGGEWCDGSSHRRHCIIVQDQEPITQAVLPEDFDVIKHSLRDCLWLTHSCSTCPRYIIIIYITSYTLLLPWSLYDCTLSAIQLLRKVSSLGNLTFECTISFHFALSWSCS